MPSPQSAVSALQRPLIGITADIGAPCAEFGFESYAVQRALCDAVFAQGGLPVPLPLTCAAIADYLDRLDGLVLSGGADAFPAHYYRSGAQGSPYGSLDKFQFSEALLNAALSTALPVLGICAGMQLLAASRGARLAPIAREHDDSHWRPAEVAEAVHPVHIVADSRLGRLLGITRLSVNSVHRECVAEVPGTVDVVARADDGVIEAVELADLPFALGVQWHPECLAAESQGAIFSALVNAAARPLPLP